MLAPDDLVRMLDGVRAVFGLAPAQKWARPTPTRSRVRASSGWQRKLHPRLDRHAVGGAARASGARPHPPAGQRLPRCRGGAGRRASHQCRPHLRHAGESIADWRTSLDAAVALEPDHVSAYALVVEEGTRLAAQVRRGQVPAPEDDDEAAKYELADEVRRPPGTRGTR